MVLMLVATPGMIAPAATATKPAIKAYSMRSWPRVSFQILSFQTRLVIRVIYCSPWRRIFSTAMSKLSLEDAMLHRSEEHTSELQSLRHLVCRLLLEKK